VQEEYVLAITVPKTIAKIESIKTIKTLTPHVVIETFTIHTSIPIV
jgi:hypothetical protein